MKSNNKICAVVVTFNRKELLLRTLSYLYKQTLPLHSIVVIDNASNDGTNELLQHLGYLDKSNLFYHKLVNNTGGAGGFYEGTKIAHESDVDWIWLMDDDGYPPQTCLETLLEYQDRYDFYGPLVLSDQDKTTLSFPITLPTSKRIVRNKTQLDIFSSNNKVLSNVLIPFNGVLLRSSLVSHIGYPLAKFFIWGDDIEYTKRARKSGARIATITDIEFYHPTAPSLGTPMFFGKMQFNDTNSKIKLYCLCRNNTVNLKKYHGNLYALLFSIKTIWFYSFTQPSLKKLKFSLYGLSAGWFNDFSKHRQFIGKTFE
ncbi:glycosyltransferase family 2 protein [Psychrobacter sp. ANT_WB68]|uniref:glycosyltransferase family 2 protein n=1 Tax=Psychrobacter sp. ANT_WB68 TaxID=2597355 RepID=UPI0011F3D1EC|nr:glycosyltransferase family 2 protein [Psychrobacter sp. ANT_WB68]KAA0913670.1 glycosyltransferase [Psychrobacter sp. ANT_WB68]